MPTSTPGRGTPISPSIPPKAITIGNVTGSSHTAGAPSWAPHRPTDDHRQHVVEPRDRVVEPGEEALGAALLDVGPGEGRPQGGEQDAATERVSAGSRRAATAIRRLIAPLPGGSACAGSSSRRRACPRRSRASARRSRGQRTSSTRNERSSRMTSSTNATCPSSTPTLKSSSASGISAFGRPIAVRPLAKPKPCSRPKAKATTHGWRIVKLVSPRQVRTISGPRNRIDSAIAALSGGSGALA